MPSNAFRSAALADFQRKYNALLAAAVRLHRVITAEAGTPSVDPRVHRIALLIADEYKLPVESLASRIRTNEIVEPRHIAIWLCARLTNVSNLQIGYAFARDHALVTHACRKIDDRRATEPRFAARLQALEIRAAAALKAA